MAGFQKVFCSSWKYSFLRCQSSSYRRFLYTADLLPSPYLQNQAPCSLVIGTELSSEMQPLLQPQAQSNTYLALRDAKIARNNARLQELGLLRRSPPSRKAKSSNASEVSLTNSNKRRIASTNIDSYDHNNGTERRKSLRLRRSATDLESLVGNLPATALVSSSGVPSNAVASSILAADSALMPMKHVSSRVNTITTTNSARDIHLNVPKLLFGTGNPDDAGFLGRPMSSTGKAHVMNESALQAGNINPTRSLRISFNKYSGVQEWGGNVLYLWINLGTPNSEVVNQFFDHGRTVNWFGGSRMHMATPVICKLIHIGTLAANADGDSEGAIVLWARKYCRERKGFHPYICLGRLSLASYDPSARPIAFLWNLLDYNALMTHPIPNNKKTIEDLFKTNV